MQATDWIAICAVIIALASLYVAVNQTRLTRQHNRLSVMPLLGIYRLEFKDKPIEYILRNQGLGTGTISNFKIYLDDTEIKPNSGNVIYDLLDRLEIERDKVTGHLICINEPISSGQEISIMKFMYSENDENIHERLVSVLPRVKFKINYKSMYDELLQYEGNGS